MLAFHFLLIITMSWATPTTRIKKLKLPRPISVMIASIIYPFITLARLSWSSRSLLCSGVSSFGRMSEPLREVFNLAMASVTAVTMLGSLLPSRLSKSSPSLFTAFAFSPARLVGPVPVPSISTGSTISICYLLICYWFCRL